MKRCSKCKLAKRKNCFSKHRGTKDRLQNYCKSCIAKYATAPEQINRRALYKRKWRKTTAGKLWEANDASSSKGRARRFRYEHSVKGRATKIKNVMKRNAVKLKAVPLGTNFKAIAKIYARSAYLKALGYNVEVDHRIPLAGGGLHSPENLRIIYADDNRKKGARINYPECFEFPLAGEITAATV